YTLASMPSRRPLLPSSQRLMRTSRTSGAGSAQATTPGWCCHHETPLAVWSLTCVSRGWCAARQRPRPWASSPRSASIVSARARFAGRRRRGTDDDGRARRSGSDRTGAARLMARLLLVGLSHHAAPLEVRERVALDEATWRTSSAKTAGTVLLSTCNRVEVYA